MIPETDRGETPGVQPHTHAAGSDQYCMYCSPLFYKGIALLHDMTITDWMEMLDEATVS